MGRISMPQGKGSLMHNRRDYEKFDKPIPSNIDVSKSSENITFVDRDIRQAYDEFFGKALAEYNDKQKRADRRIDDYCDHIRKSKNGEKLFYEDVVQWGEKKDFENPEVREKAKAALVKYIEGWQERNPNLRLIGAYLHMDEASPHLHIDYVPVATGYSRGLAVRNSLDRAMKEMGICPTEENRKNNATKMWKETERECFGRICRELGLEVEQERKSSRKSLSVEEYKEARDEMFGELEQEKEALVAEVEPLRELKTGIDEISKAGTKLPFGYVAVKEKDLKVLTEQSSAYRANRDEIENVRERSSALDQREASLNERGASLDKREAALADLERAAKDEQYRAMQEIEGARQARRWQENLNTEYGRAMQENAKLKSAALELNTVNANLNTKIDGLNAKLGDLRGEMATERANHAKVVEGLQNRIEGLKKAVKDAIITTLKVVQAVRSLKYDREDGYGVSNLTPKQSRLIDGITKFGAYWAREDGHPDLAEQMEKTHGVSNGIKDFANEVQSREVKKKTKGRDIGD